MKVQAIRIHSFGGPEVLRWETVDVPEPAAGEVLVRHTAVGLNFIDVYHRSGLYSLDLPSSIGVEAAGVVEAVGADVSGFSPGNWVASIGLPPGTYAEKRLYPASRLVGVPAGMPDEIAAAALLKGLTAWYLLRRSYRVKAGDWLLVYAAAGGTGTILTQWAHSLGARVIGVVGSEAKAAVARENGCAEALLANDDAFVARVKTLADGGVHAVYDSVGKETFLQSLDCLRPHGTMISFGNASGPVAPFSPMELARRGSLHLTRPSLFDFIGTRAELEEGTGELFTAIGGGVVQIHINQRYPLHDAARAHRDLESRQTTGSSVLVP